MLRLIFILVLMAIETIPSAAQVAAWKDSYRSYTINVDLKDEQVVFDYELYFTSEKKKGSYKTSSIDTFVLLLQKDMATFPADKQNVLFYFHGMFGGQILNYKSTLSDFRQRYIDPESSDMSRVIGYRWPGNSLDYPQCKINAHTIAEAMNDHFRNLVKLIEKEAGETSVNVLTHSLGSELFKEMMSYENKQADQIALNQVVICAPDLDENEFEAGKPLSIAKSRWQSVTVYHSNKDFTLTMSKNFNNKNRLGLNGPIGSTAFGDNLSFVETSKIADEKSYAWKMTGHSYVRASDRCSGDILCALTAVSDASIPHRKANDTDQGCYLLTPAVDQK